MIEGGKYITRLASLSPELQVNYEGFMAQARARQALKEATPEVLRNPLLGRMAITEAIEIGRQVPIAIINGAPSLIDEERETFFRLDAMPEQMLLIRQRQTHQNIWRKAIGQSPIVLRPWEVPDREKIIRAHPVRNRVDEIQYNTQTDVELVYASKAVREEDKARLRMLRMRYQTDPVWTQELDDELRQLQIGLFNQAGRSLDRSDS